MRAMILQLKLVTIDLRVSEREGADGRRNSIASRNGALENIVDRHPNPYGLLCTRWQSTWYFPSSLQPYITVLWHRPAFLPIRRWNSRPVPERRMPGALFRPASSMIITAITPKGTTPFAVYTIIRALIYSWNPSIIISCVSGYTKAALNRTLVSSDL